MAETKLEVYVEKVLGQEQRSELLRSLPAYIKPEVFERNLLNALMANPKLLAYDARLVYREVSKAAAIGLLLDPVLGEAYLVPSRDTVQLRIGYKGLMKLARISLNGATIYAHEVYDGDSFGVVLGTDKRLWHEPRVFHERGNIQGYYAVIKYKDGEADFECMSVAEIHKIRDRAAASTAWKTDEVEMCKKTVIRRLMKRQPQSPELARAFAAEDAAEFPQFEKRGPGRPFVRPPPTPPREWPANRPIPSLVADQTDSPPPPPDDDDFPGDARTAEDVTEVGNGE